MYPNLEERRFLRFKIIFAVRHAAARAHHLYIASLCPANIAKTILMRNCAGADIGDNFHIAMVVRSKAASRRDGIIIPDTNYAPSHPRWIMVSCKTKMVAGI